MPLTDAQREKIKGLSEDEKAEFLEALGIKSGGDSDLLKTVEALQSKVEKLEKAATRRPGDERRKKVGASSWFDTLFGGA